MATREMEDFFHWDEDSPVLTAPLLPPFPSESAILHVFPEILREGLRLQKTDFLSWVNFTLENPDEIWEHEGPDEERFYHYLNFVAGEGRPPLFVVELACAEDAMEVQDYSMILRKQELNRVRSGHLVYSRAKEWERERVVRALNEKALAKYDEECLEEARQLIDVAIRMSGTGSAYLFNNRGLIWWKMGRTDEAKADFLASINLDEGNGDPYFNIGLIYFDESDFSSALHYLRRAVEINPVDSQFLTELGHLYLELEREEDALKLFRQAFENDPDDAQVDFHLGYYFLYKRREPLHAIRYYSKGLKKDPEDQFALADLAVAHWVLGNTRKTLKIHRLLQRSPRLMPYTISRLVYLNMEMGDYEAALKYYRQALSQNEPFEPEWLHYNAAIVYAKTGRPKQALDILDLAVKAGGEAVIKRALSDKALQPLKRTPDFKKLIKLPTKRRNR
jgi:tetratricopeptide (TPR) repeat protein